MELSDPDESCPYPFPVHNITSSSSSSGALIQVSLERRDSQSSNSIYEDNSRRMLLDHMTTHLKISKTTSELLGNLNDDVKMIKESQAMILKMLDDLTNRIKEMSKYVEPATIQQPTISLHPPTPIQQQHQRQPSAPLNRPSKLMIFSAKPSGSLTPRRGSIIKTTK